jgi:hypothetical protein
MLPSSNWNTMGRTNHAYGAERGDLATSTCSGRHAGEIPCGGRLFTALQTNGRGHRGKLPEGSRPMFFSYFLCCVIFSLTELQRRCCRHPRATHILVKAGWPKLRWNSCQEHRPSQGVRDEPTGNTNTSRQPREDPEGAERSSEESCYRANVWSHVGQHSEEGLCEHVSGSSRRLEGFKNVATCPK